MLLPFAPRSYDVWAFDDMAALIDEVNSIRDGLNVYAVMNQADPGENSQDNADAVNAVQTVKQFTYLPTPIRRRKAFSNASGAGLSVLELLPVDTKATGEIKILLESIFNIE